MFLRDCEKRFALLHPFHHVTVQSLAKCTHIAPQCTLFDVVEVVTLTIFIAIRVI